MCHAAAGLEYKPRPHHLLALFSDVALALQTCAFFVPPGSRDDGAFFVPGGRGKRAPQLPGDRTSMASSHTVSCDDRRRKDMPDMPVRHVAT